MSNMMQRILVIDDTEEILEFFRMILEEEGYEVHLSSTTPESLTDIEHVHPDLLILDFMMGEYQEGWRLLQKVKMYKPTASIPLILCTAALNEVREQEEFLQQKGIRVVFKPFEIDDLVSVVSQALETHPLR
jgi:CheY-like chemotaxis protein